MVLALNYSFGHHLLFVHSVAPGIVVILFFQCITALFAPAGRGIKWILVAHTTAMFSFVTIYTATNLNIQSAAYIDNRQVPGAGPTGYQRLVYTDTVDVVSIVMFVLNAWLADGLLVSSPSNPFAYVSDVGRQSSFIVATLSIPPTAGLWLFHA